MFQKFKYHLGLQWWLPNSSLSQLIICFSNRDLGLNSFPAMHCMWNTSLKMLTYWSVNLFKTNITCFDLLLTNWKINWDYSLHNHDNHFVIIICHYAVLPHNFVIVTFSVTLCHNTCLFPRALWNFLVTLASKSGRQFRSTLAELEPYIKRSHLKTLAHYSSRLTQH